MSSSYYEQQLSHLKVALRNNSARGINLISVLTAWVDCDQVI